MHEVMEFMLLRLLYIGVIAVGLVLLGLLVVVVLKKVGLFERTRDVVGPVVRERVRRQADKGTVSGLVLRSVAERHLRDDPPR